MSSREIAPWEMSEIKDAPAEARRAAQAVRELAGSVREENTRLSQRISDLEAHCNRMAERLSALELHALVEAEAAGQGD